jgi:hypothetical protein
LETQFFPRKTALETLTFKARFSLYEKDPKKHFMFGLLTSKNKRNVHVSLKNNDKFKQLLQKKIPSSIGFRLVFASHTAHKVTWFYDALYALFLNMS